MTMRFFKISSSSSSSSSVGFWAWVVHPMGLSPFCGVGESQLLVCVAVSTAAQDTPGARNEFVILLFEVAPEKI